MKILNVTPWFPSFDIDTTESKQGIFQYRQATKLAERGHDFKFISVRWRGQSNHEVIADGIEVYRIPAIFIFPQTRYPVPEFIALSRKIRQLCRRWTPDLIIYSHLIYLTALPILWLKKSLRLPTIVTTDVFPGISWFYGSRIVDFIGHLYSRFVARRILELADGIQFMTSSLINDAIGMNIDTSKVFISSHGVDTELFKPVDGRDHLRKSATANVTILYVGRLDLVKGVNYLLQAAEVILDHHSNVTFHIVGDGGLRGQYEKFAADISPSIIFAGWRDDIPNLMANSDMFVLPSLSEGAPNVVMEASASGLPVIASEVGGIPEIVSNGLTGILVKPGDVNALVEAIERLMDDPLLAKRMGEMGRKRIEQYYGWGTICDKLTEAYLAVINRRDS